MMKMHYLTPAIKVQALYAEQLMETLSVDGEKEITDPNEFLGNESSLWDYEEEPAGESEQPYYED